MKEIRLSQIHPSAFAHPYDKKATASLEKVPLLPSLLKGIAKLRVEEWFRAYYMHNGMLLGPRQLPSVWRMVNQVAERFGMPSPTSYVSREGSPNAFVFGLEEHSLVLTTELVDLMSDRELEAIVAHELAHILCQHMLYRKVGLTLTTRATEMLAPITRLSPVALDSAFKLLLLAWSRSAEYTADRAALLLLQDPEALASCLSRLAGVPKRLLHEFDPRHYVEQIERYEEQASTWSRIVTWDVAALRTHPEPTKRASAILQWAESDDYRRILAGHFTTRFDVEREERIAIEGLASCVLCGSPVGDQATCPQCGLDQDPTHQKRCVNDHPASLDWAFCQACGEAL